MTVSVRPAAPEDVALVLAMIRELADYEKLSHEVEAGEAELASALFGPQPRAFCEIAEVDGEPAGVAALVLHILVLRWAGTASISRISSSAPPSADVASRALS